MVFVMHTGGGGGGRSVRPGSEVEEGKVLSVGWLQGVQQVWPGVRQAPRQCHSSCSRTNSDHAGKHNYTPSTRVHDNVAEIDSTDWSNGKSPSSILSLSFPLPLMVFGSHYKFSASLSSLFLHRVTPQNSANLSCGERRRSPQ